MKEQLLPAKLKELRKAHGYTQDYVAAALGVVRQTYSHYESGRRTPNPGTLYKLAGIYGISVDDLMQLSLEIDRNIYYDAPAPTHDLSIDKRRVLKSPIIIVCGTMCALSFSKVSFMNMGALSLGA